MRSIRAPSAALARGGAAFAIMALTTGILGGGPVYDLPGRPCLAAGRHGPDVFADERLSFAALAEADLQPTTSFHSEPVSAAYLVCQTRTALNAVSRWPRPMQKKAVKHR